MNRVAVFGGSFDPPTIAHVLMASQILSFRAADQVWFVPCGYRPDKNTRVEGRLRLEMTRAAIRDILPDLGARVKVDTTEIDSKKFIPSIYLLAILKATHPCLSFSIVIGEDLLPALISWDEGPRFLEENHFIVVPRPASSSSLPRPSPPHGFQGVYLSDLAKGLEGMEVVEFNVSSTQARMRLELLGIDGCLGLLSRSVLKIIEEEGLYGIGKEKGCK